MTIAELLGRVQYGTMLEICDAETGEKIFWRALPWYANIEYLFADILTHKVTSIMVKEGALRVELRRERQACWHCNGTAFKAADDGVASHFICQSCGYLNVIGGGGGGGKDNA